MAANAHRPPHVVLANLAAKISRQADNVTASPLTTLQGHPRSGADPTRQRVVESPQLLGDRTVKAGASVVRIDALWLVRLPEVDVSLDVAALVQSVDAGIAGDDVGGRVRALDDSCRVGVPVAQ